MRPILSLAALSIGVLVMLASTILCAHTPASPSKRTSSGFGNINSRHINLTKRGSDTTASNTTRLKFPDLGFTMPSLVPSSIEDWWTKEREYAFLGFSYEVTACELSCSFGLFSTSR